MKNTMFRALAGCSALFAFAACGSEGAATSSTSDVTALEAELAAAAQSEDSAKSVASACFQTFEACASAAGADVTTCKSELKACLPDVAPAPSCGGSGAGEGDGGVSDGGMSDGDDDDRGKSLRRGGRGRMGGMGSDGGVFGHGDRADGGASDDDDDHDGARRGPRCRAPRLTDGALAECRDEVASSSDPSAAQGAHSRCVTRAFAGRMAELCTKAQALCADPAAPAEVCARVSSACSARSGDAGI